MDNRHKLLGSNEAAAQVGISKAALMMWLMRNPALKPRHRLSGDDFRWSQEDIARVLVARAARHQKKKKVYHEC